MMKTDKLSKEIGIKINKLRMEKKMSMRELGEKIGVSHAHVSKLESGINTPSIELLETVANYFNINILYFFTNDISTEKSDLLLIKWMPIIKLFEDANVEPVEIEQFITIIKKIAR